MKCLDKFNRKMNINGGSIRNENIRNSRMLLKETFADDASLSTDVYFWELGLKEYDNKTPIAIRIYGRAFSNANGVTAKFQSLHDCPIYIGDVLYDSKYDEYFICTESFDIDDIHWQGKLTLCNWILRWQNKNGDILEYPCHDMNATQYNSGEQANKQFTIGSSQHMLTLPYDDNTAVLKTPQRFFLDKDITSPASYIVSQNDTTSYNYGKKGLVKLTVTECAANNATDRIDLGICDYFEKDEIATDNSDDSVVSKSIIFYDTTIIKSGGDSQLFTGKFFDDNGNEINDISPHWRIISDFNDALVVEEIDNQIRIGIDDDAYVDEEFKIVLSDASGNYSSSLIVRIESLL